MSLFLLDTYPSGATIYANFHTFDSNGASITLTGLATTDIEIYKNGSVTQRASDAGFALLDTDGIDFDSITGIQGLSIDLADNTDAGFYAVGSQYTVVLSSVTVDTRTVNFILGTFRIVAAESTAGYPNVTIKSGTGTGEVSLSSGLVSVGTIGNNVITAASIASDAITDAKVASDVTIASVTGAVGSVTGAVGSVTGAVGSIGANGISAASFASDSITAAKIHSDVTTELQSGLATSSSITTLQTSVDDLPTNAELATALGTADDAVLAAIAALNNLSAAQVNAEVVDALATDTYAEPTGVPAATASLAVKLGRLHQALRNRIDVTATEKTLYDDANAALWKKTLSDNGTTYSEAEGVTP